MGSIELWTETIGGRLRHENRLPLASARSVLAWWRHLHRLSLEAPEQATRVVRPLMEAPYRDRITAGLPEGVPHLHKFGSYKGNYHDSGIIYTTRPYILVVLTAGAPLEEADAAIARVYAEIYRVMAAPPGIAGAAPNVGGARELRRAGGFLDGALDHHGDPLPDPDAHRGQAVAAALRGHLVHQRRQDPRARCSPAGARGQSPRR